MTRKKQALRERAKGESWSPALVSAPVLVRPVLPRTIWSTVLLREADPARERPWERLFFGYSVGQQVPGAPASLVATRLETNMMVASQTVDEPIKIRTIDLVIPGVALADYQFNPSAGPYRVSTDDVRGIASAAYIAFFAGGDKPLVECPTAARQFLPGTQKLDLALLDRLQVHGGGWIARIADLQDAAIEVRRIEKFWARMQWIRSMPSLGRCAYNPAVIPLILVLNGEHGGQQVVL